MALINAVVTDRAREIWPKMFGSILSFSPVSYFRIGEGGWHDPGTGRVRRDPPDRTLLSLDLIADPARAIIDRRYFGFESFGYFQKSLTPSDLVFEGTSTLRIRCFLDFGEYNTKNAAGATLIYNVGGLGVSPEMWELAVFDAANNMLAYGTFPKQTKDVTKQIANEVRIVF
jgi:hypothetical protein